MLASAADLRALVSATFLRQSRTADEAHSMSCVLCAWRNHVLRSAAAWYDCVVIQAEMGMQAEMGVSAERTSEKVHVLVGMGTLLRVYAVAAVALRSLSS